MAIDEAVAASEAATGSRNRAIAEVCSPASDLVILRKKELGNENKGEMESNAADSYLSPFPHPLIASRCVLSSCARSITCAALSMWLLISISSNAHSSLHFVCLVSYPSILPSLSLALPPFSARPQPAPCIRSQAVRHQRLVSGLGQRLPVPCSPNRSKSIRSAHLFHGQAGGGYHDDLWYASTTAPCPPSPSSFSLLPLSSLPPSPPPPLLSVCLRLSPSCSPSRCLILTTKPIGSICPVCV